MGFIRPTSSLHGAPVLFVKKKDGSLRLCVDFHSLNCISKKDRYPLPLISGLLDSPHKARVYSKIDLCHAYYLVRISNSDEWKTAFRTRYRSFEWSVMPFGLTNAPVAFQRFMNDIFSDLLDVCVVIYLDDILIYSNNMSEYYRHVKEVLKCLRKADLYAKAEKCEFHSELVEYLGYILSPSGLTMSDNKIKIIQDWPEPKKVKDIQSFLGFANFYRWFIFNYSDIVIPLTRLTWKDIPWKFDSSHQDAFNSLKKAFTSAPILTYWILNAQLIVKTDVSDYALAAILSIVNEDNEVHPVAFHSCTFTAAELIDNRIYVPSAGNLRIHVFQYNHDHILAGHFGQNKTLELVRCGYSWPSLCTDVQQFCKFCITCMRSKPQRHKPYGSLKQLPIPERPWNSISMDFIEKLLLSSGFNTILVTVDRLTKQAIFIPAHDTITSVDLAYLFVLHMFSKHGVPSHVTSDRGSEFVSNFFRSLGTALDMQLYFTSGYHPKGDGQTKCMNQTLEQYLCVYCNY